MEIGESREGEALVLALDGRVDSGTAPSFETRLATAAQKGEQKVVVDFADVGYISSAGLRALLSGAKKVQNSGGRLAICGINMNVREVFEISGFLAVFTACADRASAVAFLS